MKNGRQMKTTKCPKNHNNIFFSSPGETRQNDSNFDFYLTSFPKCRLSGSSSRQTWSTWCSHSDPRGENSLSASQLHRNTLDLIWSCIVHICLEFSLIKREVVLGAELSWSKKWPRVEVILRRNGREVKRFFSEMALNLNYPDEKWS